MQAVVLAQPANWVRNRLREDLQIGPRSPLFTPSSPSDRKIKKGYPSNSGRLPRCLPSPERTTQLRTWRCLRGFLMTTRVWTIWTGCAGPMVGSVLHAGVRSVGGWRAVEGSARVVVDRLLSPLEPSFIALGRPLLCGSLPLGT